MQHKKQKGFTLIELLVVIAIIGLLASVVLLALNSARQKSRDAKRLADVRQLASALELYFNDNNRYPDTTEFGTAGTTPIAPAYIGQVPEAPEPVDDGTLATGNKCSEANGSNVWNDYVYTQTSSGAGYTLTFCLGGLTGGYQGGHHTLSPSGIQ